VLEGVEEGGGQSAFAGALGKLYGAQVIEGAAVWEASVFLLDDVKSLSNRHEICLVLTQLPISQRRAMNPLRLPVHLGGLLAHRSRELLDKLLEAGVPLLQDCLPLIREDVGRGLHFSGLVPSYFRRPQSLAARTASAVPRS